MKGSVYQRCGCKDAQGRPVKDCERLRRREAGHGRWWYRIRVDGGHEERKGGFKTKREASAALAKVAASVVTGEHYYDERQTVGDYLTRWIDAKEANGLRAATVAVYRLYIQRDLLPELGRVRLGDLRVQHVERLLTTLQAAGRGATTVRRVHATLRSALSDAKRKRLVAYNAAVDVDLPAARRPEVHPWSAEELVAFLDGVAAAHRLGGLYEVLALTGMRRGEVCGLRWEDVDLDRGVITVRRQLVEVNGRIVEGRPKTRAGERRVEIGRRTIEALTAHRLRQELESIEWDEAWVGTGRVFTREDGSDLFPSFITKLFGKLARATGLRPVRLHDLRHGAASLAMASGVDLAVISKRLGHSSIQITADIYGHLLPGVGRQAADAMEAALRPPAQT